MSEIQEDKRCRYELAVEDFFGLSANTPINMRITATYEQLCGLIAWAVEHRKLNIEQKAQASVATGDAQ